MLKKILQKYFRGEPTRPKNTLKILPGVVLEYLLNKIEIPKGAAAEGRHSIFYPKDTPKIFLGVFLKYFSGELALPGSIF